MEEGLEEDDETWKREELLDLRLRTAVGQGSTTVSVCNNGLNDDDAKVLVALLKEAEVAARERYQLAKKAQAAADRGLRDEKATSFDPYLPDPEPDLDEIAFQEACDPDDDTPAGGGGGGNGREAAGWKVGWQSEEHEAPPSYRFTPRSQRVWHAAERQGAGVGRHASGRARILFRSALQRHTLRQKALVAAAAVAAVEYEEGGRGCSHLLIQQNHLGSLGVAHVGTFIRASETLESIALGRNPIGDTGAALLGRALQASRGLRELALQECGIGPKGMRHLSSGLSRNRSLKVRLPSPSPSFARLRSPSPSFALLRSPSPSPSFPRLRPPSLAFAFALLPSLSPSFARLRPPSLAFHRPCRTH